MEKTINQQEVERKFLFEKKKEKSTNSGKLFKMKIKLQLTCSKTDLDRKFKKNKTTRVRNFLFKRRRKSQESCKFGKLLKCFFNVNNGDPIN